MSSPPAAFIANARTIPTGASGRSSSSQRRALMTLVTRNNTIISATAHQFWTRAWATTSGRETVRSHSQSRARPNAVCRPRRTQRFMSSRRLGVSQGAFEVEGGAQLGAVEATVSAWRGEGGVNPAATHGAIEGRLADSQQPGGFAGRQQAGAVRIVLQTLRESFDLVRAEPPVTTRGDKGGSQEASRHGAENRRLAHAQAGCYILRTDQSVQDVCGSKRIIS
ncbi:MAG: hypothetical protein AUI15_18135 [Actinobacteria bacterium 13_2_20CM_2_66_6]|nr:MAG: hypothetical protein AUI15_18135 [Actinobacteria bacterium 13_2_20CM_2_66_6]